MIDRRDHNNRIDFSQLEIKRELRRETFHQKALETDEVIANLGLLLNQEEFSFELLEKAKDILEEYQSILILKSKGSHGNL